MSITVECSEASCRVLIVEDIPRDVQLLQGILQEDDSGVEVTIASTLAAAVDRVEADDFSVILLDMDLPDSMGLQSLVALYERTKVPIVVVMNTKEDQFTEVMETGAADCWRKERLAPMHTRFVTSLKAAILRRERREYLCELEQVFKRGSESLSKVIIKGMGGLCLAEMLNS